MQTVNQSVVIINIPETRELYVTNRGLPRKEYLKTVPDLYEVQGIPLSDDPIIRCYQLQRGCSVVTAIRWYFRAHHCNFVDPKIGKLVLHGFTQDEDKQQNSQNRCDNRAKAYRISANTHKQLMAEDPQQLEML